ncbi:MAG: hypothetical protein ABI091_23010 [Ferruginibacter sp.]
MTVISFTGNYDHLLQDKAKVTLALLKNTVMANILQYHKLNSLTGKQPAAGKNSGTFLFILLIAISLLGLVSFILFASIELANAISKLTAGFYWGFIIVAGIYFLLGIMLWKSKERLLNLPIMNAILRKLFNEEE